jgi:hypothetical protein
LNAKVGTKYIFKPTIRNVSLHEIIKDSGVSHIQKLIIRSTMFPHGNIHKFILTSPGGRTHNQICNFRQTEAATVSKRRGNLLNGILFLQDNAAPHKVAITHQKLTDLHFEVLKHTAYSPELATLDYWLSPNLKKHLKGREFSSIEEATLAADGWFCSTIKSVFFWDALRMLEQRSHRCVELSGDM